MHASCNFLTAVGFFVFTDCVACYASTNSKTPKNVDATFRFTSSINGLGYNVYVLILTVCLLKTSKDIPRVHHFAF